MADSIVLQRHTTYGLGGLRVEVRRDGTVALQKEPFMPNEKVETHAANIDAAPLFEAFDAARFAEMTIPQHTGVPDELYVSLVYGGRMIGKFASAPEETFERLVALVRERVGAALDAKTRARLTL